MYLGKSRGAGEVNENGTIGPVSNSKLRQMVLQTLATDSSTLNPSALYLHMFRPVNCLLVQCTTSMSNF